MDNKQIAANIRFLYSDLQKGGAGSGRHKELAEEHEKYADWYHHQANKATNLTDKEKFLASKEVHSAKAAEHREQLHKESNSVGTKKATKSKYKYNDKQRAAWKKMFDLSDEELDEREYHNQMLGEHKGGKPEFEKLQEEVANSSHAKKIRAKLLSPKSGNPLNIVKSHQAQINNQIAALYDPIEKGGKGSGVYDHKKGSEKDGTKSGPSIVKDGLVGSKEAWDKMDKVQKDFNKFHAKREKAREKIRASIKPGAELYIEDAEHSVALQECAFEAGYQWADTGKKVQRSKRYSKGVIIFNADKTMEHYDD